MEYFHRYFVFLVFCLNSLYLFAADEKVVYGVDDRLDVYETFNPLYIDLAKSTAAQIPASSVVKSGTGYVFYGTKLKVAKKLCPNASFSEQVTGARCSGFLVAPDLLVTAGHCMTNQGDCSNNYWVFDYKMTSRQSDPTHFSSSQVYKCAEIINQTFSRTSSDFALIRLNRVATDRTPLLYRTEGTVSSEANLVLIGHPSGLPTKIAAGANIRDNSDPYFFTANTDSFGGNSGAAVFDAYSGLLEGILVRGEDDYEEQASGCYLPKVCTASDCRGEDIVRITNILEIGEAPQAKNLTIDRLDGNAVRISWIPSTIKKLQYRLFFDELPSSFSSSSRDCNQLDFIKTNEAKFVSKVLDTNTDYVVTVCSETITGKISKSAQKIVHMKKLMPKPLAPVQLVVSNITTSSAQVNWESEGGPVEGFNFGLFKKEMATDVTCRDLLSNTFLNSHSFDQLQSETDYVFIVCAKNADGVLSSSSSQIEFKTPLIKSPSAVSITEIYADAVSIQWDKTGGNFLVATLEGKNPPATCEGGEKTESTYFSLIGLKPFTFYSMRICGVSNSGEISKTSLTAQFITPAFDIDFAKGAFVNNTLTLGLTYKNVFGYILINVETCLLNSKGLKKTCENQKGIIFGSDQKKFVLTNLKSKSTYQTTVTYPEYPVVSSGQFLFETP